MAAVGSGQAAPPPKADMAPVLQQLNLASLRTRTQDLRNANSRILHAFTTQPSLKWSEVLGQFAMVNVELLNLVEDIKPILKVFVVYPKNVNAENYTSNSTVATSFFGFVCCRPDCLEAGVYMHQNL
jgi:hypothetical protein